MNQLVTTITAAEAVPHDPETGEITEVSMNTEITPPAAKRKMPLQPILKEKVPPLPTPEADRIDPNWDIAQVAYPARQCGRTGLNHEDGVRPRRGGRFQPRLTRQFAKPKAGGSGPARPGKADPLPLVLMLIIAMARYVAVDRAGTPTDSLRLFPRQLPISFRHPLL